MAIAPYLLGFLRVSGCSPCAMSPPGGVRGARLHQGRGGEGLWVGNRSFGGITAFWVSLGFQDAHPLPCRPQVAYEEPDFIKDVAEKDWGWTYETAIWTEPADVAAENKIASKFVPQTRAFVVSNDSAVVLIFRGARAWRGKIRARRGRARASSVPSPRGLYLGCMKQGVKREFSPGVGAG